jgi:ferric-dicitrate binding protein FerR (iron transport regulator)
LTIPLEQALHELNRYNRQQLTIGDPATATLKVSGTYVPKELLSMEGQGAFS